MSLFPKKYTQGKMPYREKPPDAPNPKYRKHILAYLWIKNKFMSGKNAVKKLSLLNSLLKKIYRNIKIYWGVYLSIATLIMIIIFYMAPIDPRPRQLEYKHAYTNFQQWREALHLEDTKMYCTRIESKIESKIECEFIFNNNIKRVSCDYTTCTTTTK